MTKWRVTVMVAAAVVLLAGAPPADAGVATKVNDFEGTEDPKVKYLVKDDKCVPDDYSNITDAGDDTVRMTLRYRKGDWWDGDQRTDRKDRQRAEVKGIGPHQKDGEVFEYETTFRTDPDFATTDRFCHVFQVKATDGDKGAPLVVLSLMKDGRAALRYWSGDAKGFTVARELTYRPGVWQNVKIRLKVSKENDGFLKASVDGDEFAGAEHVALYRPQATDYRPKWGLYRGVNKDADLHDDWVEHKRASARKVE